MKKYGILIGRFQPLHLAHQSIINEILHDGLIPIIFIGSSDADKSEKNPFSYIERAQMIHEVYGNQVVTLPLPDFNRDEHWVEHVEGALIYGLYVHPNECVLYFFRKDGEFDVADSFPMFKHKQPSYPNVYDGLSATKIRSNPEEYKQYLDGRIYKYLKKVK